MTTENNKIPDLYYGEYYDKVDDKEMEYYKQVMDEKYEI